MYPGCGADARGRQSGAPGGQTAIRSAGTLERAFDFSRGEVRGDDDAIGALRVDARKSPDSRDGFPRGSAPDARESSDRESSRPARRLAPASGADGASASRRTAPGQRFGRRPSERCHAKFSRRTGMRRSTGAAPASSGGIERRSFQELENNRQRRRDAAVRGRARQERRCQLVRTFADAARFAQRGPIVDQDAHRAVNRQCRRCVRPCVSHSDSVSYCNENRRRGNRIRGSRAGRLPRGERQQRHCVDKDASKIATLKPGKMPIYEPGLEEIVRRNHAERAPGVHDRPRRPRCTPPEIVFIAVGTPQGEDGSADLQHVLAVARDVGAR